jgi:hypothetical protein
MGGTVHELDRLTKALERNPEHDPYALLLRLAGCTARADVFAGTSAGGINGAALALAQVNRDADLGMLRGLWIEQGRLESLLRQPFQGDPTSLLRGDEYFLPALHEAMSQLAGAPGNRDAEASPVDLTITTTVLGGNQTVTLDSMGQKLPQTVHAGLFHWHRSARSQAKGDPFDPANIELTAHQLALASRSTASFPVAFEPSYIPVNNPAFPAPSPGAPTPGKTQRLRPDMSRVVRSWGGAVGVAEPGAARGAQKQDRSRYVIDGGVLANTPTVHALRAVEGMQADGPVRRVMLLVYPHAPSPDQDTAAVFGTAPTVAGALNGLLGALSGQGGRTYADQLEEHNRRAAGRRGTRSDILDVTSPAELYELAHKIYPHYRQLREWRAARDLASRLAGNIDDGTTSAALPAGWNYERVRTEAERAQQDWRNQHGYLPYVPAALPPDPVQRPQPTSGQPTPDQQPTDQPPATSLPAIPAATPPPAGPPPTDPPPVDPEPTRWGWGVSGALGVAEAANELLRQLVAMMSRTDADYHKVAAARQTTFGLRASIEATRHVVDDAWVTNGGDGRDDVIATLAPNKVFWTLRLAYYDHLMVGSQTWDDVLELIKQVAEAEGDLAARQLPRGSTEAGRARDDRKKQVLDALTQRLDGNAARSVGQVSVKAAEEAAQKAAEETAMKAAATAAATGTSQAAQQPAQPPDPQIAGAAGRQIGLLVDAVVAQLAKVIKDSYWNNSPVSDKASNAYKETERWRRGLGLQENMSQASLLVRLVHLEVAATALGDEVSTGATQPVELVQLSAQTENGFAQYSRTADDKLGGWSLNRFGGFVKRSWRANDWAWGRVDAATVLCRTVLHPSRIRRTARLTGYLTEGTLEERVKLTLEGLVSKLFGEHRPDLRSLLDAAGAELDLVLDGAVDEGELPASLPALADLFARAIHEQVVVTELPAIATAIRADKVEGGYQRSRGEVFLASENALLTLLDQPASLTAQDRTRALQAFDAAGIGREPLREESSSDMTIRTATTAAAVVATVLSSGRSGLKAISPVTKALRGLMLLPYWVVTGLTARGGLARTLSLLALALGGTLLALSLFGALPDSISGPATALGASAVLVAFAYAALRTGTLLHGIVLLSPVIPLLTYSVVRARDLDDASAAQGSTTLIVVIALTLVLMLLGSFGATYGSVWSAMDRVADRRGVPVTTAATDKSPAKPIPPPIRWLQAVRPSWRLLLLGVLVVLVAAAVVLAGLRFDVVQLIGDWPWPTWAKWVLVILVLALATWWGGKAASKAGQSLQALARVPEIDDSGTVTFTWKYQSVTNPRGVAVGWSVLYGIGYELLAVALLADPFNKHEEWWYRAALITAVVFAVTLVLITPRLLPIMEFRAIRRIERTRAGIIGSEGAYATELANRGLGYRHYVTEGRTPNLTAAGQNLRSDILNAATTPQ